jgi:hypothetical protein
VRIFKRLDSAGEQISVEILGLLKVKRGPNLFIGIVNRISLMCKFIHSNQCLTTDDCVEATAIFSSKNDPMPHKIFTEKETQFTSGKWPEHWKNAKRRIMQT